MNNHEKIICELLFKTLQYIPRLDRLTTIEDIPTSKAADWRELKRAIESEMGISVSEKSILNLASKGGGIKNQTANIIAGFVLLKEQKLTDDGLLFSENISSSKSNFYFSKY